MSNLFPRLYRKMKVALELHSYSEGQADSEYGDCGRAKISESMSRENS